VVTRPTTYYIVVKKRMSLSISRDWLLACFHSILSSKCLIVFVSDLASIHSSMAWQQARVSHPPPLRPSNHHVHPVFKVARIYPTLSKPQRCIVCTSSNPHFPDVVVAIYPCRPTHHSFPIRRCAFVRKKGQRSQMCCAGMVFGRKTMPIHSLHPGRGSNKETKKKRPLTNKHNVGKKASR
jgi:hypothetical protein